jgi:peptidoglycan/LPS O-acetylase OafA/YrhL
MATPSAAPVLPAPPASAQPLKSTVRLPALDGVRGLAILLVLTNNLYPERPSIRLDQLVETASNAGWIGVDLFFVLSGFLITGILLDGKGAPNYFRNFYARRFLRIFPLYYGVLLVLLALVAWGGIGTPEERAHYLERQGWYWTYLVNLMTAWIGSGAAKFGTGPFWSLAVEEQFYLIWPLVVSLLPRRRLVSLSLLLLAAAVALRTTWRIAGLNPEAMYLLTPARMDALAVGALLAVGARSSAVRDTLARGSPVVLGAAGALLLALAVWRGGLSAEDVAVQTAGYTLIGLMFGSLIAVLVTGDRSPRLCRAFEMPPLRLLGRYSYGIYIFQGPVMFGLERSVPFVRTLPRVFGSQVPAALLVLVSASALSIGLAMVSWHCYETRFLRLKHRFPSGGATVGTQNDMASTRHD